MKKAGLETRIENYQTETKDNEVAKRQAALDVKERSRLLNGMRSSNYRFAITGSTTRSPRRSRPSASELSMRRLDRRD